MLFTDGAKFFREVSTPAGLRRFERYRLFWRSQFSDSLIMIGAWIVEELTASA